MASSKQEMRASSMIISNNTAVARADAQMMPAGTV
jgi:hypothetical protein